MTPALIEAIFAAAAIGDHLELGAGSSRRDPALWRRPTRAAEEPAHYVFEGP